MAGLFGTPSPEEIRARIGKTGSEQALSLASLPAGRGPVFAAAQAGSLLGSAITQAQGIDTPEVAALRGAEQLRTRIQAEGDRLGINVQDNPIEFGRMSAGILFEEGEVEAASNALSFANTMDEMVNLPKTALQTNIKSIFGLGPQDNISDNPEAAAFMRRILTMQADIARTRAAGSLTTPDASASGTEFSAAFDFVADKFADGLTFPFDDTSKGDEIFEFNELENPNVMADWVAQEAERLQKERKRVKGPVMGRNEALDKAWKKAKQGVVVIDNIINDDIRFDATRIPEDTTERARVNTGGQDVIKFNRAR